MSSLLEQASIIITPNGVKAGKLYGLKGTDLDVVRATTATRVNSAGLIETVANNVPRLDYTGGSCPSILVEPQRTNLLNHSNNFVDASWEKNQVNLVLESQLNPEGVNSTYKITNSVLLGDPYLEKQNSNTVGTYTTSVFIKNIGNLTTTELMTVHVGHGSVTSQMVYNWNTNTFTFGGTNAINASAIPFTNGYVRLTFTYSIGSTVFFHSNRLYANGDSTTLKSALIYGFQTELGSYPTSYIPTVASAVTRNADVISKTGIADLIGQESGEIRFKIAFSSRSSVFFNGIKIGTTASTLRGLIFGINTDGNLAIASRNTAGTILETLSYIYNLGDFIDVKIVYDYQNGLPNTTSVNGMTLFINNVEIITLNLAIPDTGQELNLISLGGSNGGASPSITTMSFLLDNLILTTL